jgi:hypothetical protein
VLATETSMSGGESNAEMDALMALGELAAASDVMEEVPVAIPTGVPAADLQKWVQCCACEKWRKVPYSVRWAF